MIILNAKYVLIKDYINVSISVKHKITISYSIKLNK